MLKIATSLVIGFCLALVGRLAINYNHDSERRAYLGQLCILAEPSLQTGSRREVVEFLSGALRMRFPGEAIKVMMSEAGNAVVVEGLGADLNAQFDCPVGGRVDVALGFRYKSQPVWDFVLLIGTLLASILVFGIVEALRRAKTLVERYAVASFESIFSQKLNLPLPGKVVRGPLAKLLDVDSPALAKINASVASLQATISDQATALVEGEKNAAVARMTQMLAHDVRKPFSILRMGLGMLGSAKDPAAVKAVLSRLVPEIDKAVSSVDGLIADVMEVGSSSTTLIQEPASAESLIEATVGEIFRIYPKASIEISYDLRHTHMANVHVQKVGRVFSNIVGNAIQAMGQKGRIWFKTRETNGQIEFCVGNAGSCIPAESLPKLFDAFFTSGKKGGTGLGLAIAEKVVKAHGGRIWCESAKTPEHPQGYVEFKFTLPIAAGQLTKTTARLPLHSTEITSALMTMDDAKPDQGSVDRSELTLEDEIIRSSVALGRPLRVLVVDDEAIYRSALAAYLGRTAELLAALEVVQANNDQAATAAVAEGGVDLVITDVDMGPDSLDGFELVAAMRSSGVQSMICVHSNRIVAADHKTAMIAGADAFLPKPVARAQLLRLVLQAAQASHQAAAVVERQGAPAAPATKPEVLVVDDNIFVLEAWVDTLREDAVVHTFTSLEDLKDRLEADPEFAGRLLLAVTDMNLDGSAGDGIDVGRLLKKYRPQLRVLLSSDGIIPAGDLLGAIDLAIGKDPVGLAALSAL